MTGELANVMAKADLTPTLQSLKDRANRDGSVVFLELDTRDTTQTVTAGFRDDQIKEMNADALRKQLSDCAREEEQLQTLLTSVRQRRNEANAILARKTELMRHGICN